MDFSTLGDWSGDMSLQGVFDAAAAGSAGVGLGEETTAATVRTDAVQQMTPANSEGGGFGGLWSAVGRAVSKVTDTEMARYQAKRAYPEGGTAQATEGQPTRAAASTSGGTVLIMGGLLVVGLLAYTLARK